ncbi:hypothetical protein ZEAMMB73_Zm00001d008697 [Zea mays]|uniref:Uncharacterized protein n=1 Tax=Zea mays TaxID=4577 RepID=K7VAM6_MAIZE|nr:hypothetical protein ZEAMMB73_Zm00001d008697 [Zea mays]
MQPELLRHFQDRDVVVTDHAVRKVKLDELAVALTDGVQACISDLAASIETEVGGGKGSVMGLNQGRNSHIREILAAIQINVNQPTVRALHQWKEAIVGDCTKATQIDVLQLRADHAHHSKAGVGEA